MRLLVPTFLLLAGLLSLIGPFLTIFRETSLNDEKTGDKTEVRGIMDQPRSTERSTKQGKDNYGVLLAISFVSAPGHSQQRSKLRRECLPKVESECASYVSSSTSSSSSSSLLSSCSIKFYIGQPNDISTQISLQIKGSFVSQSDPYPAFESQMADSIRRESIEHGNLVILPMRDTYRDLTNKVIFMMRHALEKERAQYVLKIDNDHCPDTRRLLEAITDSMRTTSSEEEDALYMGDFLFPRMGLDPPFFSGAAYVLSSALARAIFFDDDNGGEGDAALWFISYGSYAEDLNVGRWYEQARARYRRLMSQIPTGASNSDARSKKLLRFRRLEVNGIAYGFERNDEKTGDKTEPRGVRARPRSTKQGEDNMIEVEKNRMKGREKQSGGLVIEPRDQRGSLRYDPLPPPAQAMLSSPLWTTNCGNHRASSCEVCAAEWGRNYCNGDCIWTNDESAAKGGTCLSRLGQSSLADLGPTPSTADLTYGFRDSSRYPETEAVPSRDYVTLVTAYFPLEKSKHSIHEYQNWMASTLSVMDNMVIFVPQSHVNETMRLRSHVLNRTRIVSMELNETYLFTLRPAHDAYWKRQHELDPERDLHCKELYSIWNEKVNFLKRAAVDLNSFDSAFFAWVDAGYLRDGRYDRRRIVRHLPKSVLDENVRDGGNVEHQMIFLDIEEFVPNELGGGFFGGSAAAIAAYPDFYYDALRHDVLERGEDTFVGKEQRRMMESCERGPAATVSSNDRSSSSYSCLLLPPTEKYGDPWLSMASYLHHGTHEDGFVVNCPEAVSASARHHSRRRTSITRGVPFLFLMALHPENEYISDIIHSVGCFECDHVADLQRAVSNLDRPFFVDVGGNIGQYSLAALAAGAEHAFVFEPLSKNLQTMCDSIMLNPGYHERASVFARALTDKTGRLFDFDRPFRDLNLGATRLRGGSTSMNNNVGSQNDDDDDDDDANSAKEGMRTSSSSNQIKVEGVSYARGITLDSIVETFPAGRPAVLKVDIEGSECDFVSGARLFFERVDVRYVSLELHGEASGNHIPSPNCDDPSAIFDFFIKAGLKPYDLGKDTPLDDDWKSTWKEQRMTHLIWKKPHLSISSSTEAGYVKHVATGGRLGNQLFEHASTIAVARSTGKRPCVVGKNVDIMDKYFVGPFGTRDCNHIRPSLTATEAGYGIFTDLIPQASSTEGSVLISGYLQSYRYFADGGYAEEEVRRAFTPKTKYLSIAEDIFKREESKRRMRKDADATIDVRVGVHVRWYEKSYLLSPPSGYYRHSMEYLARKHGKEAGKEVQFYVASDDIARAKELDAFQSSPDYHVTFLNSTSEMLDMTVLMRCDHAIIGAGTFSWWAAWMGAHQREGGEVLYYGDVFDMGHPENQGNVRKEDHYPKEWTEISF